MDKILIRQRESVYKFLNFEFEDERRGSLYIVFDRFGKGPGTTWGSRTGNIPTSYDKEEEKFRISYHPCGHVRFHNVGGNPKSIHCEPIYAITKKQPLVFISIPRLESLDLAVTVEGKDAIFDWPEDVSGRITFWIELGPPNLENPFEPNTMPFAAVTYGQWFTIFISLGLFPSQIPEGVPEQGVIKMVPDQDFVAERITEEQAVINFHQAKHGMKHREVITFQHTTGVHRIVFAVPMRVPPQLIVEFIDTRLSAEVIECKTYEVKFKVRGPGGYIKNWVAIKGFILDADFN